MLTGSESRPDCYLNIVPARCQITCDNQHIVWQLRVTRSNRHEIYYSTSCRTEQPEKEENIFIMYETKSQQQERAPLGDFIQLTRDALADMYEYTLKLFALDPVETAQV